MASDKLYQKISDLYKQIEDLRTKISNDPEKAVEVISNTLEELQANLKDLSLIEEPQMNEEGIHTLALSAFESIIISENGRIIEANEQFARMHGYELSEVIGRPVINFLAPQDHKRAMDALNSEEELTGEYLALNKDGSTFPIETHGHQIKRNGKRIRLTIVRDITERKRAEEALQQSQEKYCQLVEGSGSVILLADKDMHITFMNQYGLEFFGYYPEEIIGKSALGTIIPTKDEEGHNIAIMAEDLMRHPDNYPTNAHQNMCKDGRLVWMSWTNKPIYDKLGKLVELLAIGNDLTKLKEAEKALQDSEERYRMLFENSIDAIVLTDPRDEGRIISANPAACKMLGWPEEELVCKGREVVFDLEDPALLALLDERKRLGSAKAQLTYKRKDGTTFPGEVATSLFTDSKGETRAVVIIRDITERKRAEEALHKARDELELRVKERTAELEEANRALRASEQRLILAQKAGGVGVYDWNLVTGEFFCTPELEKIYGRTTLVDNKLPTDLWLGYIHPEDRPHLLEKMKQSFESTQNTFENEFRIIRPDSQESWVASCSRVIRDSNNRPLRIIGTNIDITERKQAEEKLRKQALMLDSVSDAVIGMDLDYRINYWSPSAEKMYGYRAEEVFGRPSLEVFKPDYLGITREEVLDRLMSTGKIRVEAVHLTKDGCKIIVESNSQLLYNKEGKPYGLLGANRDTTERKTVEKELVKAKEAAEAAAKAKEAFMANMSHELRTPMNYIVGMTSLLLDEPLSPDLKDCIETIKKGSDEMMVLINNILDFSRVEKEKVTLEYQPLNLRALIEESLEAVASQAIKRGLNLTSTVSYGVPENILGDYAWLTQVLTHILSNAVKFTDEGEISLSVSSKHIEGNKHQFLFAVKDTGIGIPPEKMSEIFQPFAQVETNISRKRNGAGIGLAVCRGIVKLMGGEIWAKSETGKGSTFYSTIEAEIAPDAAIKSDVKPEGTVKAIPGELGEQHPLRILIAEDITSNQKILLEMLKRLGYRADAVANGKEVLQALEMRPYDMIFMDVKIPMMDGITAAKEIRRRWPNNGPKIIAITAYAMSGDKEKCLEAGMDDYISKPVKINELANILSKSPPPKNKI